MDQLESPCRSKRENFLSFLCWRIDLILPPTVENSPIFETNAFGLSGTSTRGDDDGDDDETSERDDFDGSEPELEK